MKVDVFLITAKHHKVVRVPNGQTFNGSIEQDVFVLKNGKAERRTVKIGLSNFNYVEILSGLKVGEEIIVSDMDAYKHVKSLTVKP
jgi:HlyD family secretion protein